MLKLRKNIPSKELEKYGFKPKYDEDTGEIDRYVYKIESIDKVGIIVKDGEVEITETYTEVLEVLYVLIKKGIVIKEGDLDGKWYSPALGELIRRILNLINDYAEANQADYSKTMIKVIRGLEELL